MATAPLIESPAQAVKNAIAANNARRRAPGDHERMKESLPPVFVFNVSDREFKVPLGSQGLFVIPACKPGQRFAGPVSHGGKPYITGILPLDFDQGDANGRMGIFHDFGKEVAEDVVGIGSSSPGLSLHTTNREWWGVFISATATRDNPVPSDGEIEQARAKLMQTAMLWFNDGMRVAKTGKLDQIISNHRWAAEFTNQKVDWAGKAIPMENCPGCQEPIKPGVKVHGCGTVIDPEGALALGMITQERYDAMMGARNRSALAQQRPSPAPGQPIRLPSKP